MKGKIEKFFAITLAACMSFFIGACEQSQENSGDMTAAVEYSYLTIDINPSIELVVKGETVVKAKAGNEDAAILLSGEDFTDMTVEEVSQSIVELAEELGYLTTDNSDVKITVSADSASLGERIKDFATKGAQKGSDLAQINSAPRSADERKVKELQTEDALKYKDLTPEKLRLIEAIMKYDENMTYEIGAQLKVSELADRLEDYVEEYGDIVGEELEALFEEKWKNFKDSAKDKIAERYGEEYKAAWERYVALGKVAKEIEAKAKNVSISEEDMQAIMELLGMHTPEIDSENSSETASESDSESDREAESVPPEVPEFSEIPEGNAGKEKEDDKKGTFDSGEWLGAQDEEHSEAKGEGADGAEEAKGGKNDWHGDWKVQDYDDYFDRNHHDKWNDVAFEAVEDEIEAILEKYDEDNYLLTEEDLAAIVSAWGEAVEMETFGDLKDFLDEVEENLEALRCKAEETLGAEDKGAIEIMEEASKQWMDKARDEMKEQIEKAQDEWKALKEEKRNNK